MLPASRIWKRSRCCLPERRRFGADDSRWGRLAIPTLDCLIVSPHIRASAANVGGAVFGRELSRMSRTVSSALELARAIRAVDSFRSRTYHPAEHPLRQPKLRDDGVAPLPYRAPRSAAGCSLSLVVHAAPAQIPAFRFTDRMNGCSKPPDCWNNDSASGR